MDKRELEQLCGERLSLDKIKEVITSILPYITSGKIRFFIYNIFPDENLVCVANDVSLSYYNDVMFRTTCFDETGSSSNAETLAMDYFEYMLVITEKMVNEAEGFEVYDDIEDISKELAKVEELKKKPLKLFLRLSSKVEFSVETPIPELRKLLEDWYYEWLTTGRYTPVFLFKLMVNQLRKHGLIVIPNILETEYNPLLSLLY
jgi:hypothetical protein